MARSLDANGIYTVDRGDTLWWICNDFLSQIRTASGQPSMTIAQACYWVGDQNNIPNINCLYVGQKISITGTHKEESSTSTTTAKNSNAPVITYFGPMIPLNDQGEYDESRDGKEIVAIWTWTKDNTSGYHYYWQYTTGVVDADKKTIWFSGEEGDNTIDEDYAGDTSHKDAARQSIYTFPDNATKIRFKVKATSKTYKSGDKDVHYWSGDYCSWQTYTKNNLVPETPETPTVTQTNRFRLDCDMDNVASGIKKIEVQIYKNGTDLFKTGNAKINETRHAHYTVILDPGAKYCARWRVSNGTMWSNWSEFSDQESVKTVPDKWEFKTKVLNTTLSGQPTYNVNVTWSKCKSAEAYRIEYMDQEEYRSIGFSPQATTLKTIDVPVSGEEGQNHPSSYLIPASNIGAGTWVMRFAVVVGEYHSDWSDLQVLTLGLTPNAPTTWSSSTSVVIGTDTCSVFWTHNARDNSVERAAQFYYSRKSSLDAASNWVGPITIMNNRTGEKMYELSEAQLIFSGATIPSARQHQTDAGPAMIAIGGSGNIMEWKMATAGGTGTFSEQSVVRLINLYTPASMAFGVYTVPIASPANVLGDNLTAFPFYIYATCGNTDQSALTYYVRIQSNTEYDTIDNVGHVVHVSPGDSVYENTFDQTYLNFIEFNPSNISLYNTASYTVYCEMTTNAGLTDSASQTFTVAWTENGYLPNCEIGIDYENLTASIRPYCEDEDGEEITDVYLSIYRREFDGSFKEIQTDILAEEVDGEMIYSFVTDPHPALDFARYRIVSKEITTGAIAYYDAPGVEVGEKGIIIQWDEAWQPFDLVDGTTPEVPGYAGSFLRLPYNIDVSEDNDIEVSTVNYVGREHPVSYYGTHLGTTASWSTDIPKSDKDTLFALRRLSRWMGDVYVREPSGVGYWATIKVSFSQKHLDLVIPVKIDITRVEGGI